MIHAVMQWISDLLWPRQCVHCGALGVELCAGCRLSLVRSPSVRVVNGVSITSAGTMTDEPLARSIWNLKYRNLPGLAEPLAAWAAATISLPSSGVLVPIPLHPTRQHERGYNQAELLAQAFGRILALSVITDGLVRTRHTDSQVERASRAERLKNMEGAFAVCGERSRTITSQDIILIDDVSTTGATLQAAAAALSKSGARSVSAVVLARG